MNYSKMKAVWWYGSCYHKEQLDLMLEHLDVKNYAYILHDKDLKEDDSGELKKPHYHFLIQLYQQQRGSWFKAFASDDLGHVLHRHSYAPQGAYNYLIHDTPASKHKYQYDPAERVSTIEKFDEATTQQVDQHQILMEDIDKHIAGEMTFEELIKKEPKRVHSVANIRRTIDQFQGENKCADIFRMLEIIYIYGRTDKGKTRHVMEKFGYRNVFRLTNYDDKTGFDGYKGEDVVVFEEFRGKFGIEKMLNYLDGYPLKLPSRYYEKEARYTKVYLVTNVKLSEQYRGMQAEHPATWMAFYRRIKQIYDFDRKGLEMNIRPPDPPDTDAERRKSDRQKIDECLAKLRSAEDGYVDWSNPEQQRFDCGRVAELPF